MNISKIIVCTAFVASVGFASDEKLVVDENNISVGLVVKNQLKRGRPTGSSVSVDKSKTGVSREPLGDVTNTLGNLINTSNEKPSRERRPNSLINSDHIDGKPAISTEVRKKAKLNTCAIDTDLTTSEENSLVSRASGAYSPAFGDQGEVTDDMGIFNSPFGDDFYFDEDPKNYALYSPVAQNLSGGSSSARMDEGTRYTPGFNDVILDTPQGFALPSDMSPMGLFTPGIFQTNFISDEFLSE